LTVPLTPINRFITKADLDSAWERKKTHI